MEKRYVIEKKVEVSVREVPPDRPKPPKPKGGRELSEEEAWVIAIGGLVAVVLAVIAIWYYWPDSGAVLLLGFGLLFFAALSCGEK